MDPAVQLGRMTLETALVVAAPILAVATVAALVISIVQVLTSLQEATIATVPKLLLCGVAGILLLPWMLAKLSAFTITLFGDFRVFVQ
jgi:flagellar biosynthesis protein FliQ